MPHTIIWRDHLSLINVLRYNKISFIHSTDYLLSLEATEIAVYLEIH